MKAENELSTPAYNRLSDAHGFARDRDRRLLST